MAKNSPQERFEIARESLLKTEKGLEPTMYGPLRDLFVEVLGYHPGQVDIDRSGARGRPDITVFAPGPVDGSKVAWVVLEAKDEHGACKTDARRRALFAEKSKYITADTAWFVMVDPTTLVARPADRGGNANGDVVIDLATCSFENFLSKLAELKAEVAGVPKLLSRFRDGDEGLIAVDRLTGSTTGGTDELAEAIARNAFFDGLEDTTQRLQSAAVSALTATRGARKALSDEVEAFSMVSTDMFSILIRLASRGNQKVENRPSNTAEKHIG